MFRTLRKIKNDSSPRPWPVSRFCQGRQRRGHVLIKNDAQTLLEYAILTGIVATVLVAMSPPLRRSLQSLIRVTSDQLAMQNESDQSEIRNLVTGSFLYLQETASDFNKNDHTIEAGSGVTKYTFDEGERTRQRGFTALEMYNKHEEY